METTMAAPKKAKLNIQSQGNVQELQSLLTSRSIDVNRFEPIGAGFYHVYEDCFDASVICIDKVKFMNGEPYMVKIILDDFSNEEYARFRKKFEVIINPSYRSYYNLNISDVMLQSELRG